MLGDSALAPLIWAAAVGLWLWTRGRLAMAFDPFEGARLRQILAPMAALTWLLAWLAGEWPWWGGGLAALAVWSQGWACYLLWRATKAGVAGAGLAALLALIWPANVSMPTLAAVAAMALALPYGLWAAYERSWRAVAVTTACVLAAGLVTPYALIVALAPLAAGAVGCERRRDLLDPALWVAPVAAALLGGGYWRTELPTADAWQPLLMAALPWLLAGLAVPAPAKALDKPDARA